MNLKETLKQGEFMSEQDLVNKFIHYVQHNRSPWGEVKISTEFFFYSGRTDVLLLTDDGNLIAIEAKLSNWKHAAHQAYRNTSFANQSYVLIPERTAQLAQRNEKEFERRKVGICTILDDNIKILRPAERLEPLQFSLHQKAVNCTLS